jgi:hypothetical protein
MEITKIELKKLMKEFLYASNRVLRADFEDYGTELAKFVSFLNSKPLINNYIRSCGAPEYDSQTEFNEVNASYGRAIFSLGSTNEAEVANIYSIISYLAQKNISGRSYVFYGYSSSTKYQEKVDAFGDKFIRVLINHIENYLACIGIDMGLDDKIAISIHLENSNMENAQINVAAGEGTVNATQIINDLKDLDRLISEVKKHAASLSAEDRETVDECVETIETLKDQKPKKRLIKAAITTLKAIVGTAEFAAACAALIEFASNYL